MHRTRAILVATLMVTTLLVALTPTTQADPPFYDLTLVAPAVAEEGESTTFSGQQKALGRPVPAKDVRLLVDGVEVGRDVTTYLGDWSFTHRFPVRGTFTVEAVADKGLPTETHSAPRTIVVAGLPDAVSGLLAEPSHGLIAFDLTWSLPAETGGIDLDEIVVERHEKLRIWPFTEAGFSTVARLAPDATDWRDDTLTQSGFSLIKDYEYRVSAKNALGPGEADVAPITADALAAPVATAVVESPSATRVSVEAAGTGGPVQAVAVERSTDGGATWSLIRSAIGASGTWPVPPAQGDVRYRGAVANNVETLRGASFAPSGAAPGVPVEVSLLVDTKVRLTWSPPTTGGPAQGYHVWMDGARVATLDATARAYARTVSPGTHSFEVQAWSEATEGARSAPLTLTIDAATTPSPIEASVTENLYTADATLTWSVPMDDGGSDIAGYHVYRRAEGASTWTLVASVGASTLSWTDRGLSDGRGYEHEVRAHTAAGEGAAARSFVTVSDYDWVLVHDFLRYEVCEDGTCTTVADGGTYHHGGEPVTYKAFFEGTLTRKGEPMDGLNVWAYSRPENDPHLDDAELVTTDAAGAYTSMADHRYNVDAPPGCRLVETEDWAYHGSIRSDRMDHSFWLCS